jgi:hypothetical protein
MTDIALSRTAKSAGIAAFGKNSERIETMIPYEAKEILEEKAATVGMALSEYMRTILLASAYGPDEYQSRTMAHVAATLGIAGLNRGNLGIDTGGIAK